MHILPTQEERDGDCDHKLGCHPTFMSSRTVDGHRRIVLQCGPTEWTVSAANQSEGVKILTKTWGGNFERELPPHPCGS